MTRLKGRLWEDVQIGVNGTITASALRFIGGSSLAHAFSYLWHTLLWLVPTSFVGTEFARGLHALIIHHRQHKVLKVSIEPTKPPGL